MPPDLRFAYNAAIKSAAPLLRECLAIPLTESQFRYVQSALAALHGFIDLAFVIEALDTCFTCPSCETSVAVMESRLNCTTRGRNGKSLNAGDTAEAWSAQLQRVGRTRRRDRARYDLDRQR